VQVAGDGLFGHGVSRWLLVGCWLVVGGSLFVVVMV
jgi:hypothetical protein